MSRVLLPIMGARVALRLASLGAMLAALGGCALGDPLSGPPAVLALEGDISLPTAAPSRAGTASYRAETTWAVRQCRPPASLCGVTIGELERGGFLDFRASPDANAAPRLLSPFAVVRTDALDRSRCTGKLCAAHVALAGLVDDLLRQGYHTHAVATFPGSAMLTLRTERIDASLKVLKGSCRFNLDLRCQDLDTWLQDDKRSGEACGFAQTRVLLAAALPPQFVAASQAQAPAGGSALPGTEGLRAVALDAGSVKVYELVYMHKICRNEMTLVRNG